MKLGAQLKILTIILSAQVLVSCSASETYVDTSINIPDQPANVLNAGGVVTLPEHALTKKETNQLILSLRKSELKNARAVNSAKRYHKYIQNLYGKKKQ